VDIESDDELPTQSESCELNSPPKKQGLNKREGRGKFTEENITENRHRDIEVLSVEEEVRLHYIGRGPMCYCVSMVELSGIHHSTSKAPSSTKMHKET
jgi:hypothetical protein